MRVFVIILFAMLVTSNIVAQDVVYDTLTDEEVKHEFYGKTKFEFKLARDKSIFKEGNSLKGSTLKAGIRFKTHYKVGLALFFSDETIIEVTNKANVNAYRLSFNGFGMYTEYIVFKNYRYEFTTPVSLVSVRAKAKAYDEEDNHLSQFDTTSNKFGMLSLGLAGTYNLNYWLGVGLGVGYRFSFSDNAANNAILSTPFYSFGIKIQIGKLYKTVVHHEEVLKLKSIHFKDKKPGKSARYNKRYHEIARRKAKRKKE